MSTSTLIINTVVFGFLLFFILRYVYKYIEQTYAEANNKPFYLNFIIFKKDLTESQIRILEDQFSFYQKISADEKIIFRHRVNVFIESKQFYGREGVIVTDEMNVLISATAVMLTFGFRKYQLPLIKYILIYPEAFYSKNNEQYHKGEVNPKVGVIALSWKDFKHGYDIDNDNLNLGIHEFGHAIHLSSFKRKTVSAHIFMDAFNNLKRYLKSNETKRQELISTKYFRAYAYTNEFEFVAVLIECFIETPEEFESKFPKLYNYVKQMLNFRYATY